MASLEKAPLNRRGFCAATLAMVASSRAWAEQWPSKPLKIICNFPPGSSPDVVARAVSTPLSQALGQPVVVENRAGAGGIVGAGVVAKSAPDGYTLLMSSGSTMSIAPHMTETFQPGKELVPIAAGARIELFLLTRSDLPFKDYQGFVAYAKRNPGKLTYASPGNGTAPHIAGEMLKSTAGFFALHIPYKGSSLALQDLLAGQVDYAFDPGVGLAHVRSGKLRLLAVGSKRRSQQFPDTPTLQELGLAGFDAGTTHAFYAPVGTPAAVVERLHGAINAALRQPEAQAAIRGLGAEPSIMSLEEFQRLSAEDSRRYAAVIKQSKITAD